MDNTGIVRKIDELGRLVIPKEIRKSLNIRNGDNIEIIVNNNKIILKKYEKLFNISDKAQMYLELFSKLTDCNIIIVDFFNVIASLKKEYVGKKFDNKILSYLDMRQCYLFEGKIIDNTINNAYLYPLIIDADLLGGIIIYGNKMITDKEKMLVNVIGILLSNSIS